MKLFLFLSTIWLIGEASKGIRVRNRPKNDQKTVTDVCDLEASDGKNIRCFCAQDKPFAVTAECWIYGPIEDSNFLWRLILNSQTSITELNLMAINQTRFLPSDLFERLKLKKFSITMALLERLKPFQFSNSSHLESIELQNNHIEFLDMLSLSYLPKLKFLDLQKNRIRIIPSSTFSQVPELMYVRLNNNNLTKIEDRAFAAFVKVVEIDLAGNRLCDINNMTFYGLPKLKVLDLSANRIVKLESSVFFEMWDLEELYLDDNNIQVISNRAFDGLRYLKNLSLANNKLSTIPAGLLTGVFTLINLDFSYNNLETLEFNSIERFYINLAYNGSLLLEGNKLGCDCRLDWIYRLARQTAGAPDRNSLEKLRCIMYTGEVIPSPEVNENPVCWSSEKRSSMDRDYALEFEREDDEDEEKLEPTPQEETYEMMYLLSISEQNLPCPPQYRPTPITVKQATPTSSNITTSGSEQTVICAVYLLVSLFLM